CYARPEGIQHLFLGTSDEVMPKWWIVGQEEVPDFDWDKEEVYRNVVMVDPLLWFRPSASSLYAKKALVGFRILELVVRGKNELSLEVVGKQLEEDTFKENLSNI
ncbi:hypothetical protein ACLOJK_006773, partial [Asimina triloba]